MPTIDAIRDAGERDIEAVLRQLDERHKALLRAAIERYGIHDIPDEVWQEVRRNTEEQTTVAIILLLMMGDDWTTTQLEDQGVKRTRMSNAQLDSYRRIAATQASGMAETTTTTLRNRLRRRLEDEALRSRGGIGGLTDKGVEDALDEVFTQQRRETVSIDTTTQALTFGQRGAAERATEGDGASTTPPTKLTIELVWRTEKDNLVCPRCAPLEGQPERVWGQVFPSGPGPNAHPNCRCFLEPTAAAVNSLGESVAVKSYREADETDDHWITLDNGVHVKVDGDGVISDGPKSLKGKDLDADQTKGVENKIAKAKANKKTDDNRSEQPTTTKTQMTSVPVHTDKAGFKSLPVERIASSETRVEVLTGGHVRYHDAGLFRGDPAAERDYVRRKVKEFFDSDVQKAVTEKYGPGFWRATNNKEEAYLAASGNLRPSFNHADNRQEEGVSVTSHLGYAALGGFNYVYRVDGKVVGVGSDGEPLLDTGTLKPSKIFSGKSREKLFADDAAITSKVLAKHGWTDEQFTALFSGSPKLVSKEEFSGLQK